MTKKTTAKKRKPAAKRANHEAIHQKLEKIFSRPAGATVHDTGAAGYNFPAIAALNIFKRRGYKTAIKKQKGELTVYRITQKPGAGR